MTDLLTRWVARCNQWAQSGYDALSREERVWLNIRSLIDSTENGGLISFFYNSGADTFLDCLAALRHLDALAVLREIERVAALFPQGVAARIEERNRIIDSWPDGGPQESLLAEVDAVLMPLMSELELKLSKFLGDAGLVA